MNLPTTAGSGSIADGRARFHIQRGDERSRDVALVSMSHRAARPFFSGPPRVGAIQRLNQGFLVSAEHHASVRRVEIVAYDIGDLLLEYRIIRDLEHLSRKGQRF